MNFQQSQRQSGFTLLEVVVALTLTAALMGLIYGALHTATQSWRVITQTSQQQDQQFRLLKHLRQQLQQARPIKEFNGSNEQLVFSGENTELSFVAALSPLQRNAGLYLYRITTDDEQSQLTISIEPYRARQNNGETFQTPDLQTPELAQEIFRLSTGGAAIRFSYSDSNPNAEPDWRQQWSVKDRLPQLVQIAPQDPEQSDNWQPLIIAIKGHQYAL